MDKEKLKRLYKLLDDEYGITDDLGGNGCEHGFKPARSCPNAGCHTAELGRLWDEFFEAVHAD